MEAGDKPIDQPINATVRSPARPEHRQSEAPVDLGRLSRPEAEAFRYIAQALGARFAGDLPVPLHRQPCTTAANLERRATDGNGAGRDEGGVDGSAKPTLLHAVPRRAQPAIAQSDPRLALLDRVPVAILIVVGDGVAFVNRAAAGLLGYISANTLDAAGGLGALFDGQDPDEAGVLHMRAASGRRFTARVTMATVDWCGTRAMLFTVVPSADVPQPRPHEPTRRPDQPRDPLAALLDANPDPIAIVGRGGEVEACNAAFQNLSKRAPVGLDDCLGPDDLRHVFDVMQLSFLLSDGAAQTTQPVQVGAEEFTVSVGALKNGRLACLVFHKRGADDAAGITRRLAPPATDPREARPDDATPLWRAVREARRLVRDAAVLVVSDEDERTGDAGDPAVREAETQLLRLTLIAVAARAAAGSVLTLRRRACDVVLTLSSAQPDALRAAATSDRLLALAAASGRTLVLGEDGGLGLVRNSSALPSRQGG